MYRDAARPICLALLKQVVARALSRAWAKTGKRIAARMAMIAMTTRSSIRVKPEILGRPCPFIDRLHHSLWRAVPLCRCLLGHLTTYRDNPPLRHTRIYVQRLIRSCPGRILARVGELTAKGVSSDLDVLSLRGGDLAAADRSKHL